MSDALADVGNGITGVVDGDLAIARLGRDGEIITDPAHGEFYEAVSRNGVYYACTAVAGVVPGTSLSTTAAFWLHNPIDSGVLLVLLACSVGYLSGTLGAGTIFLTSHTGKPVANPTGTAIVPKKTRLAGGSSSGQALAFTTATVTTQIAIRPMCSFGAFVGAEWVPQTAKDQINGEIIVGPGFGVGLHAIATAGTTPKVLLGMTWEESPFDGLIR